MCTCFSGNTCFYFITQQLITKIKIHPVSLLSLVCSVFFPLITSLVHYVLNFRLVYSSYRIINNAVFLGHQENSLKLTNLE